jgi:hypothetical protein
MRRGAAGLTAVRVLGVALSVAALAATPAARAGDDAAASAPASRPEENAAFNAEAQAASAPFLPELEKLGQWCNDSALMLRRSYVAETLIGLNPEHELGRKWLRYKRDSDGTWLITSAKPFFDEKPALLPEWENRRVPLAARMHDALEPLIAQRSDWRTAGTRARLLRALVAIDPDDEDLRERAGEVRAGKKWVLKESAAVVDRRRKILDAAFSARADALKAVKDLTSSPSPLGISLGTPEFKVMSALPADDVRQVAIRVVAARSLYERVLGTHVSYQPGLTVSLFGSREAAMRYVDARRDVTEERRRFAKDRTTYWLTGTEFVVSATEFDHRIDECARQVFSSLVGAERELWGAPAWMGEGVGMYLTYVLIGTRLTPFVTASKYADDSIHKELADPKCDWVQAVRKKVADRPVPLGLRILTSLPLNSMTEDDTLIAYALAAYFIEGRPADLVSILRDLKTGANFHQALANTCAVDADALEVRFVRWLRETN